MATDILIRGTVGNRRIGEQEGQECLIKKEVSVLLLSYSPVKKRSGRNRRARRFRFFERKFLLLSHSVQNP
jgi:hypothetical protein